MSKIAVLTSTLAALTLSTLAHADVEMKLGSRERVTQLFAYPNNCNVICYRHWTLEQTAEHYLNQSVQRDGYTSAKVTVKDDAGQLYAHFSGVPKGYDKPLEQLLNAGELAYKGASKLNVDGKWAYNWYLFLPLGLALDNRKSVELLHFPPDYSLTQAQDYLESATTDRWAELLTDNGIPKDQTPGYQTIVDIAPIAAPSNAGSTLETVYSYFTDYQTTMVKEVSITAKGTALPMVAFGAPVRNWIKQQYGATVGVLQLGEISPTKGSVTVPVLGSNHPSYIWYAADPASYGGDQAKADAAGLKVMGQDLSAACWQAGMGQKPSGDPAALLKSCTDNWQVTNTQKTCVLFYESVRKLSEADAEKKCTTTDVKTQLDQLKKPAPAPMTALPVI
ncbi:hypothetical protein HX882_24255 [Pseudomonas gingeri]|uniref:Uncharacterized protein n=1 Tax=Pseudomonas gingeri TaxID=117681 RepID=A0A7Y7XFX6_9PSED|nr:hypothetical protein [Pseudomonas gingeri]NWA23275.1 hypothetical protein [Pseudomonas gingeri]NWB99011.1 hypothetical protein [Pseudomonas gingeri]NWD76941.1 hypothetical protein [Pseudomonas gingeri]